MRTLLCPTCSRESSPGAYVCAGCNFSFVRERTKPYVNAVHKAMLSASVLAFVLNVASLLSFQAFEHWSLLLFFAMTCGVPGFYYFNRCVGKTARVLYFAQTPAGTNGWVANDFLPVILLALSALPTIAMIQRSGGAG